MTTPPIPPVVPTGPTARVAAEDDVRHLLDPLPAPLQALAYCYLHALGFRIDAARRLVEHAFPV